MVQRTSVRGISRYGRASQGVRLMNLRDGDRVSAVAVVMDDTAPDAVDRRGRNGAARRLGDDGPGPGDDSLDAVDDGTADAASGAVEPPSDPSSNGGSG